MLKAKNLLLTVLTTLIVNLSLFAQEAGKISGKITDQKTGETLIGATVSIDGTSKGAAADVDGKYILSGLTPGRYTLTVKYIGYQSKSISDVEVKAGQVTNLDVIMSEAATQALNEVVVKATFRQASVASLYAQQKNAVSISDGVSSEAIRRSPDRNTADVLKRVSGATVQDNKFVVVRGLSDRYNTATLDGAWLPSTEPNRKAFSFDIVPSNLVEALTITKTASPDMPGDFAGGLINIATKDIPDQNFLSFSIGGGYNTASTFKNFKSGPRNVTDYFGFDNGDKKLASGIPSSAQIANGLSPEQNRVALLRFLPKRNFTIYNGTALPTQNYQFTIGKVKDFANSGNRLGAIFALTYRNSQNIQNEVLRDDYNNHYRDNVYKFSTNVGALFNLGYSFGKSKITFKNVYNRIYDDQFLQRAGTNDNATADIRYFAFDLLQKALFKSTLEGNHPVSEKGAKINWNVSYNNVLNDQPNQRKISYNGPFHGNGPFYANVTTLGKDNTTLFSRLNENDFSGALNFTLPVKMFKQNASFKTGLTSLYRNRTFNARFLGAVLNTSNPNIEPNDVRQLPLDQLFSPDLINKGAYRLDEIASSIDSYTANSTTNAGYAMLDNKIGKNLRLVWGARVEQFNLNLATKDNDPAGKAKQNYVDVLPSANLTYSLTEKTNIRASYSRTLARPEFRELARSQYYDYEILATIVGDPNLKRSSIDNIDLRLEFYPSAGQVLSVSGFYKKFKNAIETYNDDAASSTRQIRYFNSSKADVYGIEMEVRKSLDFIIENDFFKNTTAYTNVAIIKSNAVNPNVGLTFKEKERPLVGQAPYVINAGLQHTFLDNKFTFNALFNRVGRRLSVAAGAQYEGIWEAPRNVLDMQLGIKVFKNKGELKLNAGDILNQNATFYYDINKNKKYDPQNGDFTQSSYKPGSNYSFTFSYTL
ncbi:TonB-dependent receptor [Mucilaginibacter auburnensis]|uniref:TonB-dependent receptor n=1 Tax=Mucilaginibacter auburnensis TaxID=1457233 RepID=A0A2H9VN89_9SPHI|nr:TonB-dependent receptor [Mucilaginibacter auburnensis]PJJ79795.1 TonB-dependent receptor [Mucilaginibacter auburnensis]